MANKFTVVASTDLSNTYTFFKRLSPILAVYSEHLGFRTGTTRIESRCHCHISCCLLLYRKTPPAYIKKCIGDRYRQATYLVFQQKRAHLRFRASTTRIGLRCPCPISCCLLLYRKTPPAYIKKCFGDRYRQATYLVFQQKRAHLGFAASTTRIKSRCVPPPVLSNTYTFFSRLSPILAVAHISDSERVQLGSDRDVPCCKFHLEDNSIRSEYNLDQLEMWDIANFSWRTTRFAASKTRIEMYTLSIDWLVANFSKSCNSTSRFAASTTRIEICPSKQLQAYIYIIHNYIASAKDIW
jgi:hypothetical protein